MTGQGVKFLKVALPLLAALMLAACNDTSADATTADATAATNTPSTGSSNGSGTATLSWSPPTENTDGSALTDLSGYRIYYGTDANALSHSIDIATVGLTIYVVSNLGTGTWYFAIKAYNNTGVESDLSNLASKTIS